MKVITIYYSYSGNTEIVAGKVHKACGGEIVEVKLRERHSSSVSYFLGLYRRLRNDYSPVIPEEIDVSSADLVVIGTPVWAKMPTPAIITAVHNLKGCGGKKAVIFATCGGIAGETIPYLKKLLAEKGMRAVGDFIFDQNNVSGSMKSDELITAIISAVEESG